MEMKKMLTLWMLLFPVLVFAQETPEKKIEDVVVSYEKPQRYVIGGIEVTGIKYLNP